MKNIGNLKTVDVLLSDLLQKMKINDITHSFIWMRKDTQLFNYDIFVKYIYIKTN